MITGIFDGMAVLQKLRFLSGAPLLMVDERVFEDSGDEHRQQTRRRSVRRVSRGVGQECRKIEKIVYV